MAAVLSVLLPRQVASRGAHCQPSICREPETELLNLLDLSWLCKEELWHDES